MPSSKNNGLEKESYSFSDFVLDVGRRELRCRGREIELQPRVFDLLLYLVRHRERAVDKDELQDAVWPGLIVTETALTRAVTKARKAIGDDAGTQSMIKTLHGHGYRFVAELEPEPAATPSTPEFAAAAIAPAPAGTAAAAGAQDAHPARPQQTAAHRRPARYGHLARRRWLAAALVAVAAAGVIAVLLQRPVVQEAEGVRVAVLPLSDRTENPELAWTRLGLMSFVSGLLAGEGAIATVADGSVVSLVENLGWSGDLEDAGTERLAGNLRQAHGATHLLALELRAEAGQLRMNFALQTPQGDIRRGTMVGSESTALARGVVRSIEGLVLRRGRLRRDAELISADPFHNEAYARGMSLALEGRCREAVHHFRVIIEQEPGLFAPRYELASCLRRLGEPAEAEELLQQLIAEQRPLGASRPLAQALMVLGILYNRTGRLDEAEAAHGEALEAADAIGDPDLAARILHNLAIVAEDRNDWSGSAALMNRAMIQYQKAGREVLPGQVWAHQANLAMDQGRLAEAGGHLERALTTFRGEGDRGNEAMVLNNTGYLLRLQGRYEEAERFHLESLAIREDIGDRVGAGRIYGMLAVVYLARGELERARSAASEAIRIARESGDRLYEGTALAQRGDVLRALAERDAARADYAAAGKLFAGIHDRMRSLQAELKLAALDLDAGAVEAALDTAQRVALESRSLELIQPEIDAMELMGDAAVVTGNGEQARLEYAAALERVRQSSWTGKENTLLRKLAGVLLEAGELDAAAPLIGALSQQAPNADSLRVQARFAFLDGNALRASQLMEQARALSGQHWDADREKEYEAYRAGN